MNDKDASSPTVDDEKKSNDIKKDKDADAEKNGSTDKKETSNDKDTKEEKDADGEAGDDGVDDDENVVALAEIDKINENINKTRVDGLQTLHAVTTFICLNLFRKINVFCFFIC